jgi:hypothetical protein
MCANPGRIDLVLLAKARNDTCIGLCIPIYMSCGKHQVKMMMMTTAEPSNKLLVRLRPDGARRVPCQADRLLSAGPTMSLRSQSLAWCKTHWSIDLILTGRVLRPRALYGNIGGADGTGLPWGHYYRHIQIECRHLDFHVNEEGSASQLGAPITLKK